MLKRSLLVLFLSAKCLLAQSQAFIEKHDDQLTIGNNYIHRVINVSPREVGTTEIINKISGQAYKVKDDVFALQIVFSGLGPAPKENQNGENDVILTARDFQFVGYKENDLDRGGKN